MTGQAKPFEEITPEEYLKHPVWKMAFDDSEQPGWDETWRSPVTDTKNIDDKSVGFFIALRIPGTDYIANALFYDKSMFPLCVDGTPNVDWIGQIFIWDHDKWVVPTQVGNNKLEYPMILESIPDIRNDHKVQFVMKDKTSDCAIRSK